MAALERDGQTTRDGGRTYTCPAHDDATPSLTVSQGDRGALIHCHAGCTADDVLDALGLDSRELFDQPKRARKATSARVIEATYDYTDANGALLFQAVRYRPKDFRQRRPDGQGGWVWKLADVELVPYRLPELVAGVADGKRIYVVEGEKDVEALRAAGRVATCNPMGAGKWRQAYAQFLRNADVYIVADKDEPGRAHARTIAATLEGVAKTVRVVEAREGKDAADHLAAGFGADDFVEAPSIAAAAPLAETLEALVAALRRYVVFPDDHAPIAIALWIAHTHAFDQAECTPYLAVISPEKRSGKTRTLDVCERLVAKPWRAVLPSEAVVFRKIAADTPTLLLDEVDAIFGPKAREHEGLRALLNAGHRAGSTVPRCVGEGPKMRVEDFATFCPKALAGIGELPDTVADRSIAIRLRRRAAGESVARFRAREAERELAPVRGELEVWARSAGLADARPQIPEVLEDRTADGWEALLAIAEAAGAAWAERARAAAIALSAPREDSDASLGVRLLTDLRGVFGKVEIMFSRDVCTALNALEERPWGGFNGGKGIDGRRLARLLKPYSIRSRDVRIGEENGKGFRADALTDAWSRYCPSPPFPHSDGDTVTTEQGQALTPSRELTVSPIENADKSAESLICHRCHREDGQEGGDGRNGELDDDLGEGEDWRPVGRLV